MEAISLILVGILGYFLIVGLYAEEPYVSITYNYLAILTVVVMSYFSWQFAVQSSYSQAIINTLRGFFIIQVFLFGMFNFYLLMKLGQYVYNVVMERYIK